ncbi:MAG: hypothetical protein NT009_12820 [Proteobacteria bacterium]|nr:hypothetical protein [Pseudomonadota bacterium]
MKKLKALKIINLLLLIVFFIQASTGMGHNFIDGEWFAVIHRTGGILLLIFAVSHLILNWGWVKANFLKAKGEGSKVKGERTE